MSLHLSSKRAYAYVVASVCIFAFAANAVAAESAKSFYAGKTVRLVVGYGAGGGYDTYARMLAPHLSKRLGATVVVENRPGAGGLTALNDIYVAKPDGLRMMLANGSGAAISELFGSSAVRYDLARFGYLGTVSSSPHIWLVTPGFTPTSPSVIRKSGKLIRWGSVGVVDGMSNGEAMTCHALGLKCKIVPGYKGSRDVVGALARGEVDAMYLSDTSANHYVRAKDAVAVASMAPVRSRFFPHLKTIYQAVKLTPARKSWVDFSATLDSMGEILVTSPGVPEARLRFLQAAVKKVLTDPKVVAEGEKVKRYIEFVDAEKTRAKAISLVASISKKRKAEIQRIVRKDYR